MFVQVQQRWRRLFFGILLGNGFRTSFEMAHMRKTPPQCQNLFGLLDVFKSKLVSYFLSHTSVIFYCLALMGEGDVECRIRT